MSRYAAQTDVTSDRSRAEIERILQRYNASSFMYGWEGDRAVVAFQMNDRRIRFDLPMPDRHSHLFTETDTGRARSESAAHKAWEQACRQRWRALALVIKAKLEAVESGITEFEGEFLAHIQLPDGQTAGAWMRPQIERAYQTGEMPALLPAPGGQS
ncbi:hypothetical protein [Thioalkalivibrio sp. ARh3]|uniref:hypothetical protein n=1 Tax=Thioalkalivibrio sp. ARh3 TaxID=1158148 RepID=UPI00036AC806|nr:hypothetical protein [Thioalkalivibrio sp. ARh3]